MTASSLIISRKSCIMVFQVLLYELLLPRAKFLLHFFPLLKGDSIPSPALGKTNRLFCHCHLRKQGGTRWSL